MRNLCMGCLRFLESGYEAEDAGNKQHNICEYIWLLLDHTSAHCISTSSTHSLSLNGAFAAISSPGTGLEWKMPLRMISGWELAVI